MLENAFGGVIMALFNFSAGPMLFGNRPWGPDL
jgi:hypothetical protein